MKTFLILGGLILAACSSLAGAQRPAGVFEGNSALAPKNQNPIDDVVFARLKELNIPPARVCSDAVFVRRFLVPPGTASFSCRSNRDS